jgi:hypothetical protein
MIDSFGIREVHAIRRPNCKRQFRFGDIESKSAALLFSSPGT